MIPEQPWIGWALPFFGLGWNGFATEGSLTVRLDQADHENTQSEPHAKLIDITGKDMRGSARIEPAGIVTKQDLKPWMDRAVKFVPTLPAKSLSVCKNARFIGEKETATSRRFQKYCDLLIQIGRCLETIRW